MIPNITRGRDMRGLVTYLFGPGRENEHTRVDIIAASPDLALPALPVEERPLDPRNPDDRRILQDVTAQLDSARRAHPDVEIRSGKAQTGRDDAHVWHCSLSLPPGEHLDAEQWREAVEYVLGECGLRDVSWIAVNHGPSKNEGEHVHIAATVLKDNGRECWIRGDRWKAQEACGQLERRWGLQLVEGRSRGVGAERGVSPAETSLTQRRADAQAQAGAQADVEPDRITLQRQVRAAARASNTEAEFVRRLRASGVECIPRYDTGTEARVVGCSFRRMAVTGRDRDERRAFSGGRLAKDLTLPKMREWAGWHDVERPAGAEVPAEFYRAWPTGPAWQGPPAVGEQRETLAIDVKAWDTAQANVASMPPITDPADTAALAATARETSAALAALAQQVEGNTPGELARLADLLARSAQAEIRQIDDARRRQAMLGVATIATQAALHLTRKPAKGGEVATWTLLAAQLIQLASIIARAHEARAEASRAAQINTAIRAVQGRYWPVTAACTVLARSARSQVSAGPGKGNERAAELETLRRGENERGHGR